MPDYSTRITCEAILAEMERIARSSGATNVYTDADDATPNRGQVRFTAPNGDILNNLERQFPPWEDHRHCGGKGETTGT